MRGLVLIAAGAAAMLASCHVIASGCDTAGCYSGAGLSVASAAIDPDAISHDDESRVRDGDNYSLRILTAAGVELASRSWSATYVTVRPNGEHCTPTCRHATLTEL